MNIVVAGGGLAALRAVEALRVQGWEGPVAVISDEQDMPYDRPPLSKELLWGESEERDLVFAVSEAATEDVTWKLGNGVVASDLDAKTVTLKDGEVIPFDGLLIATGVSSRRLSCPGPQTGRTALRTLQEAREIRAALRPGQRIVILGAGFIGCEVAATARKIGCEVDIVAIDPCTMFIPLGLEVGSEIQRRHEASGVRFHMGRTITETLGSDRVTAVRLDDGTTLDADLLLETIGSIPNTSWLEGNGLDLTNGVRVDEQFRAGGRPGIVVAGDAARFENPLFGSPALRVEHWQTAIDTAVIAVRTLLLDLQITADARPSVPVMPYFWSDQGEIRLTSYGMLGLANRTEVLEGDLTDECAIGYYRDSEAVGVVLIGIKGKAARYKRWLMNERKAALVGA
jgi:NADPH-dependent 2,4-dienoyl-CoA reductase/sulfur reductase-like enzyme